MKTRLSLLGITMLSTGCASIFSGTTQEVAIETTPGAHYSITNSYGRAVASGVSGGTAQLTRGVGYFSPHSYKLRISKEGYRVQTIDITPGVNPWYFANILIGGVLGMVIIDPLTGAMFNLNPSHINAPLEPATGEAATKASEPTTSSKATSQPLSRFDYAATQLAKAQMCQSKYSPTVSDLGKQVETLTFQCEDGRKVDVVCGSLEGCR